MWIRISTLLLLCACSFPASAGPRVDIVIGEQAPSLEKLAADELQGQLTRIYQANVRIGTQPPADATPVILVGSPQTNAHVKSLLAATTFGADAAAQQTHVIKSVKLNQRDALVIAGGSPAATYWAVAEYAHKLGVRSMFFGDLDPVSPPPFRLDDFDITLQPKPLVRGWEFSFEPTNAGGWGSDEFRRVLRQLAKLKFNHVRLKLAASEPWVHFEYGGVKRSTAALWDGETFPVAGDTLGRKAFGGAKRFENPDFAAAETYEQRIAAGQKYLHGVIQAAHELGMSVTLEVPFHEFPQEFHALVEDRNDIRRGTSFTVHPLRLRDIERLTGLARAQWQAYRKTFPEVDRFEPTGATILGLEFVRSVLGDTDMTVGATGYGTPSPRSIFLPSMDYPFGTSPVGENAMAEILRDKSEGYCQSRRNISEADLAGYWLSRISCSEKLSATSTLKQMLDPVCGEDVHQRVVIAFDAADQAQRLDDFRKPPAEMFAEILNSKDPPPAHWAKMRDHYLNAMNEMYRANTRAREGGRAYTLYFARRFEFAYEFMNCVEAARNAGVAAAKGERETQIAELEKAIEALNSALNAQAAVARNSSDRGLIAVLNEYGYRVLKKALADAETAEQN